MLSHSSIHYSILIEIVELRERFECFEREKVFYRDRSRFEALHCLLNHVHVTNSLWIASVDVWHEAVHVSDAMV